MNTPASFTKFAPASFNETTNSSRNQQSQIDSNTQNRSVQSRNNIPTSNQQNNIAPSSLPEPISRSYSNISEPAPVSSQATQSIQNTNSPMPTIVSNNLSDFDNSTNSERLYYLPYTGNPNANIVSVVNTNTNFNSYIKEDSLYTSKELPPLTPNCIQNESNNLRLCKDSSNSFISEIWYRDLGLWKTTTISDANKLQVGNDTCVVLPEGTGDYTNNKYCFPVEPNKLNNGCSILCMNNSNNPANTAIYKIKNIENNLKVFKT